MATTTGGFSKVHTVTSSSAVPKEWMKSLDEGYSTLRQSFKSGKTLTEDWRLGQLQALERMFVNDRDTIAAALAEDLKRPAFEVDNFEIGPTVAEIKFAMRNLRTWMKPESTMTPPLMQLGSSRVERIPKGVVLVMGAWNFPFHLSLTPCIAAIAAGNCVVLKPSDVSPASASAIKELCDKYMDPATFRVYLGEVAESTELLARKWDHIFYTGNAVIGRIVMTAAAKHLCPVTLELGGKSPVIVDKGLSASQLQIAVNRICSVGLFINAGQICVSPDYILVHKDAEKELLAALKATTATMSKNGSSAELGKVVNGRHFARLKNIVETSQGEVVCGGSGAGSGADSSSCFLPPTIISRPNLSSPAMTEELFGPLMMVVPVESLEEAAEFVNSRETPLALYVFSANKRSAEEVVRRTRSGGVLINDALLHLANPHLPFGGCGESGFGSYHGKWGFEEFSHRRAVMHKALFLDVDRYPPYDSFKAALLKSVLGLPEVVKSAMACFMSLFGC